jgi:hypothetical protein
VAGIYDPPRFTKEDARLIRVERNYFHENAVDGGGYGAAVAGGTYVNVQGNVFEDNRHAVTAVGLLYSGYIARFNYLLHKGYWYGGYHGSTSTCMECKKKTTTAGRRAGEYFEIAYNTVRGEQRLGGFLGQGGKTRDVLSLRGRPVIGAFFHDNVLVHNSQRPAIQLKGGDDPILDPYMPGTFNFHASANQYDTDHSTEFATGDFDGDRRTDVFVANGFVPGDLVRPLPSGLPVGSALVLSPADARALARERERAAEEAEEQ